MPRGRETSTEMERVSRQEGNIYNSSKSLGTPYGGSPMHQGFGPKGRKSPDRGKAPKPTGER